MSLLVKRSSLLTGIVVLGIILIVLPGCFGGGGGGIQTTYTVSGRVTDAISGMPIQDVTLVFGPVYGTATTGANGAWSKSGLTGTVSIYAAKSGYRFTPEVYWVSGPRNDVNFSGTTFGSIGDAIRDARDGDVIVVPPGTYYEVFSFMGKRITVRSVNPNDPAVVASTIIDGSRNQSAAVQTSVVTFEGGEDPNAVLAGFTIKGGWGRWKDNAAYGGGIIVLNGSSPTIINNVITLNGADYGGGIYVGESSSPTIAYNTITDNDGAAICVADWFSSPDIRENIITDNRSGVISGGGIKILHYACPVITGNLIRGNVSRDHGGGIFLTGSSSAEVVGNTFESNVSSLSGGAIWVGRDCRLVDDNGNPLAQPDTLNTYINNSPDDVYYSSW